MFKLSALLSDNGLPDRPILLIEPHRNNFGIWRIKFSYDDGEPLSMDAEQASKLAVKLHQIGQDEGQGGRGDVAVEIVEGVERRERAENDGGRARPATTGHRSHDPT